MLTAEGGKEDALSAGLLAAGSGTYEDMTRLSLHRSI